MASILILPFLLKRPLGLSGTPSDPTRISGRQEPGTSQGPTGAVATTNEATSSFKASTSYRDYRAFFLKSRFGTTSIESLVAELGAKSGGPEIQSIYQALALRKKEALPVLKEKLRTGQMWEKHMITKFLRLCPWSETKEELLGLAQDPTSHALLRQDAIYTLGALGDPSIGPAMVRLLNSPDASVGLRMASISTLARIQYTGAIDEITPFTHSEGIHLRLFANRALSEMGASVDKDFLTQSLRNDDYVIRQQASEAIWTVQGQDITERLKELSQNDLNESVRDGASQALLRRQMSGLSPADKTRILQAALNDAGRLTSLWILRTALEEGGAEGRNLVESLASSDNYIGERSRAYLVFSDSPRN